MKKKIKYLIILLIIIIFPIVAKYGTSYAKYAYNSVWNYYLKSKGFYLSSDILKEEGNKVVNNLWDGGHVYFDLKNNLNDTVSSEYDINYTIRCEVLQSNTDALCNILETGKDTFEGVLSTFKTCTNNSDDGVDVKNFDKTSCEIGGYEWVNQPAIKNIYFDVTDNNGSPIENTTVKITVTSTNPYKKTLSSEFVLNKDNNASGIISSNYIDNEDSGALILSNSYNEDRCVRVNWNQNDLRLDLDTKKVKSVSTDSEGFANEIEIEIERKDSIKFDFYENTIKDYSKDDFTVTEIECN